jgi:5-methylcytosine-specific restriction endonuclease McrA
MPPWADKRAISKFYRDCPAGFHVDHIVPLRNNAVCGLHILENMMYLPEKENLKKGNKLDESMGVGYFCRLRVDE